MSLMVSFWLSPMIDIYGLGREANLRRVKCGFQSEDRVRDGNNSAFIESDGTPKASTHDTHVLRPASVRSQTDQHDLRVPSREGSGLAGPLEFNVVNVGNGIRSKDVTLFWRVPGPTFLVPYRSGI